MEFMEGVPANWNTVLLTTQLYLDAVEFHSAIQFHEDVLMGLDEDLKLYEGKGTSG
jgi:hypothetical protein